MVENVQRMAHWHTDSFNSSAIGDGYEVEVNEFDFRDDNGICYDQDGVVIRHWRRSHTKDGATAYRLDWNGLSFCCTGDGRPDELTAEFAKGVDVLVTDRRTAIC
jgi:ribonuclease Z